MLWSKDLNFSFCITTFLQVQVDGHDIVSNQSDAFQALGYCPQHDALWRNITVREHMEAYANIRGIVPSHITRYFFYSIKIK